MIKKVLCSFILFHSTAGFACGVYQINGVVHQNPSGVQIVVAEGSNSETHFSVSQKDAQKLSHYLNLPVEASGLILKPFDGTHATLDELRSVDLRVPDPVRSNDSIFVLIQKMNCRNK